VKTKHGGRALLIVVLYAGVFTATTALGALGYFHFANPENTCASCHEMTNMHSDWSVSAHRTLHCRSCHGGALTLDAHALTAHGRRIVRHLSSAPPTSIRLKEEHVLAVHARCAGCHPQAYRDWQASRHSVNFARLLLDPQRNHVDPPADDCLRCHGQFVDGDIATVVVAKPGEAKPGDATPPGLSLSNGPSRISETATSSGQGPSRPHQASAPTAWVLTDPARATQPAIPCLSCHQVHAPAATTQIASYYSRREKAHIPAAALTPTKILRDGQPIRVSRDVRQRVCVQCHAPNAAHALGASDDRTPAGVHEGLSCRDCHTSHNNSAAQSCQACHPADSHCGLEVEKMDTTFRDTVSTHNIHRVACVDCHPGGVPAKRSIKLK
jgi:hypothetical protein